MTQRNAKDRFFDLLSKTNENYVSMIAKPERLKAFSPKMRLSLRKQIDANKSRQTNQ